PSRAKRRYRQANRTVAARQTPCPLRPCPASRTLLPARNSLPLALSTHFFELLAARQRARAPRLALLPACCLICARSLIRLSHPFARRFRNFPSILHLSFNFPFARKGRVYCRSLDRSKRGSA